MRVNERRRGSGYSALWTAIILTGACVPAIAQSEALRLITQNKVTALVGCYQSSCGLTASAIAERYGIPALVVRSLSDLAGAESHMDFASFCGAAAEGAAVLIRRLVAVI